MRALGADGDYPTHQLLPANFRFGELHQHKGTTGQLSTTGWPRPEKTHRSFGSRFAQQVARHITYDTEYGFDLACKEDLHEATPVNRAQEYSRNPQRMPLDRLEQITQFLNTIKVVAFGTGAAWREWNSWEKKAIPLSRYLAEADAAVFVIAMVTKRLLPILSGLDHRCADIATEPKPALAAVQSAGPWALPMITATKKQARII